MNEGKSNEEIWREFTELFEKDDFFKNFRSHIVRNNLGYGENQFCILWDKIISSFQNEFSFLEIGVYKGQILCLAALIAKKYNLNSKIYGVSPLYNLSDKTTRYDRDDYKAKIVSLHNHFGLEFCIDKQIIQGISTDDKIKNQVLELPPFDIIYVDGGHEYETVVSDIKLAKKICKNNGYIVADDASFFKDFSNFSLLPSFVGHKEVSLAVADFLENDPHYIEEYCVAHVRAFKKIK